MIQSSRFRNKTYFIDNSGQRTLEKFQTHLEEKKIQRDEINEKLEITSQVLVKVKAGVEHLADKLQHIKTV